jgi:hypothetical protein
MINRIFYDFEDYEKAGYLSGKPNTGVETDHRSQWNERLEYLGGIDYLEDDYLDEDDFSDLLRDYYNLTASEADDLIEKLGEEWKS